MNLTLGFSPCPNDTFIFDAMVHGKIDTEGLRFSYTTADVEELNRRAFRAEPHITKISYHAFAYIRENYLLLNSGSALGHGNGPLLVSSREIPFSEAGKMKIAIPGKYTTATLLLGIALPEPGERIEYLFSDIEDAVLAGEVDAGLLIHENRFTYGSRGLQKIADLGEYWEEKTGEAIPLGGIAVRRDIPLNMARRIDRILARSVAFAMDNPASSQQFVGKYAQTMESEVMSKHIGLYVNEFTLGLGEEGKRAVLRLMHEGWKCGMLPELRG
ncbi:MAG: 1,4-dihydroxy-6-naphthoate synthase, partial [Bacteroidales bacterium]|nr:1,4-dihydroxy-6-naphthoate synthase [Bacteroidales bacterium]